MPSEAISLALAASIYPPALAVVIALGRGTQVRLRAALLVAGAFITVLVSGSLILLLFTEVGGSGKPTRTIGAGVYIAAGAALVFLAFRLRGKTPDTSKAKGPSKTDRYLESARLVFLLGVVLYVVPSPIYIGVVKAIADTHASPTEQLGYLLLALLIMLWMIEIPMLLLLAFPARGSEVLEAVNGWFTRNGHKIIVIGALVAGLYLLGIGLAEVI
jgi:hypothetical protein